MNIRIHTQKCKKKAIGAETLLKKNKIMQLQKLLCDYLAGWVTDQTTQARDTEIGIRFLWSLGHRSQLLNKLSLLFDETSACTRCPTCIIVDEEIVSAKIASRGNVLSRVSRREIEVPVDARLLARSTKLLRLIHGDGSSDRRHLDGSARRTITRVLLLRRAIEFRFSKENIPPLLECDFQNSLDTLD